MKAKAFSPAGFFFFLLFFHFANAQKPPIKFGDIPMQDMKMKVYDKDTSASAVILADYGVSKLEYSQNNGFILHFERTVRIKILKKDGFTWADFEIPLYHSGNTDEKLSSFKGATYNLEGEKIVESKIKIGYIQRKA